MSLKVLQRAVFNRNWTQSFSRTASLPSRSKSNFYGGKGKEEPNSQNNKWKQTASFAAASGLTSFLLYNLLKEEQSLNKRKLAHAKSLPIYSADEVAKHSNMNTGIWVTYKDGVYDITDFVEGHPGGSKILLAAGGPIDPFWNMYAVHQNSEVLNILAEYKIGNLSPEDISKQESVDLNDPFANEPTRLPAFRVNSKKPFNAEPPPRLITDSFITPNELFYVRNHLPVPQIDPKDFKLEIVIGDITVKLSLDDLKKYKPYTITTTIQCAGNRREEMNKVKPLHGLSWGLCAIGTARWTGPRLKEVLLDAGIDPSDPNIKHIHLTGVDADMTKSSYGASIPKLKAFSDEEDCILAYEMNGVELPRDHGYPIRAIVPGCVGARNVKWVHQIVASDVESFSFWQRSDYKGFSPSTTPQTADYNKATSIQELPVVSAITEPYDGDVIDEDDETFTVKGYAWSGGGRDIIRVEISSDGGQTWKEAEMQKNPFPDDSSKNWAWTLWSMEVPIVGKEMKLLCRAIDSSFNCQPENPSTIWNLRGFMMNAWHRVNVKIKSEDEEELQMER